MKSILSIIAFFFIATLPVVAQVPSPAQIQQMKVSDLSDEQVRQIVDEMKKNKVTLGQIDGYARQKGISADEAGKLKDRIKALNLDNELIYDAKPIQEQVSSDKDIRDRQIISARDIQPMTDAERKRSKLFGSELFNNKNLTFEPNLRMPTPANYRLAAGDELHIDVYGYSEVQHTLSVSPEGYIRIPYLGPVYVNGLTIEEAKNRITKQLSTIYNGIKSGNTFVQVSLGNIRSIRITLIGEVVRPGSYTVSSLSTVANALYASGGPDENGSFRNIQVIRNGQPIVTFDLYDFLRNGDLQGNIILQDQDIIKVNAYQTRIELSGEVKRPAIFEVKQGETLKDVIELAGGYTDIAFKDVLRAYRLNNKEREVVNISGAEVATFIPKSGDKIFIDAVLNRFNNRVMINGAVLHPGEYALENDMTVADLIRKASGIKEDASKGRAIIFRLKDDLSSASTSFNVEDVLSGKNEIKLRREDSIIIYSTQNLRESFHVKIIGEVNNPGYFKHYDSLQIFDLVLLAGGLRDAATLKQVEVARRIRGKEYDATDSALAIVAKFDLNGDLSNMKGYFLEPFDEVTIRRSPTYKEQANVVLQGEVLYPGNYTLNSKHERISDLIRRAGGLKLEAYPDGAVMLRRTYSNAADSALLSYKQLVYLNKLKDSSSIASLIQSMNRKEQLLGIDLKEILAHPGSKYDLFLVEGDELHIPKQLQSVQLFGEIYFPKKMRYDRNLTFRDYIRGAGGFTGNAHKRRTYIVYANGDVKSTRKLLFFTSYPKVRPGAEIYVPQKAERKSLSTQEVVGLTTGIASLALIIVTILNK